MPAAPHILHVFPSFEPGGSQVRTTALMAAFGPEFRHSVLSMNGTLTAREMLPTGFELGIVEPDPGFWPRAQQVHTSASLALRTVHSVHVH